MSLNTLQNMIFINVKYAFNEYLFFGTWRHFICVYFFIVVNYTMINILCLKYYVCLWLFLKLLRMKLSKSFYKCLYSSWYILPYCLPKDYNFYLYLFIIVVPSFWGLKVDRHHFRLIVHSQYGESTHFYSFVLEIPSFHPVC